MNAHFSDLVRDRGPACVRVPKATASYYLFCMARFAMLPIAIAGNPFGSDRFAWINICIERYGARNLAFLPDALGAARERFATCYIDHVHPSAFESLSAFFGKNGCRDPNGPCGRCSLCSGFFTGGRESMLAVCDLVEAKFLECLREGYGHADEQLLTLVHHDRPDLFDLYPGDYQDMITNYAVPRDHTEAIVGNLIRNSLNCGDWKACVPAVRAVWTSYKAGLCRLTDSDLAFLLSAAAHTETHLP